jgi:ATP-binding cassette, subfamily B, bacterial CvaB/MchF/RaxB
MRVIYQNEVAECGYACLAMVLTHLGRATEVKEISAHRPVSANGLSMLDLYDVATEFGLAVEAYQYGIDDLGELRPGAILHVGGAHFVVFERARRGYVRVIDPAVGRRRISMDVFASAISGYLIQCQPAPGMPRIKAVSKVPAALERVRRLNPGLSAELCKVALVALAAQLAVLAMPFFGGLAIDRVVASNQPGLLGVLTMTFASIFVIGTFSHYMQGYLTDVVRASAGMRTAEGVVGHLLRHPLAFFEKRTVGDVFAKISMQEEIDTFATRTMVSIFIDTPVVAAGLTLMYLSDPALTAVTLGLFSVYVAIAWLIFARMRDVQALVLEESSRCDDALIETIRAAPMVKLSGGESRRVAQLMSRRRRREAALLEHGRLTLWRDTAQKLLGYADLLALTWMACRLMLAGSMSVGVFYAFMIYKSLVTERLARIINAVTAYGMLAVPAERLADIVEAPNERYTSARDWNRDDETRSFHSLEMHAVDFRYGVSDRMVLDKLDLRVEKGDKIVITGPSGSGKSTIFRLLCAGDTPLAGDIRFNDVPASALAVDEIRRHTAQVRQGDLVLTGTIADNIAMFTGHVDEERLSRVLSDVGLLDDVMRLPMRTRTLIGESMSNVSAGQRQRLLLARALYQDRELLLLDEPTSNLDPASVKRIGTLLAAMDRTMVVITHDASLAAHFARRYALVAGRLIPQGAMQNGEVNDGHRHFIEAATEGA